MTSSSLKAGSIFREEYSLDATELLPGLYEIPLGGVNAFLIDADELILIDTGVPGSSDRINQVIEAINKKPTDIDHILVTHCHPDHAGSLAAFEKQSNAPAYMHPVDAAVARSGELTQHLKPTPGLEGPFRLFIGFGAASYEAAYVQNEILDGTVLPLVGGIQAIHLPGHSSGQLAFLWKQHGGVLFAADAASNMLGLGYSLGYVDFEQGKRDLERLCTFEFEFACFGHGEAIRQEASTRFRQKWGAK